ncbi:MAG: DUF3667 domain-containing protein, partial [Chitinophagaceae bacterium]
FTTLKDLLFHPGFLSAEYMMGKRMRYLNPIRMYVFTSAIFFLIFFSISNPKEAFKIADDDRRLLTIAGRDSILQRIEIELKKKPGNINLLKQVSLLKDTSQQVSFLDLLPYKEDFSAMGTIGYNYKNRGEYDSIQRSLTPEKRDSWLKALWNKKGINLNEKYKKDQSFSLEKFSETLLHKLPYLLFVSLPFFALILKLLYLRRRKEFYYADHGIFSIHHYILSFMVILFALLWDKMQDITGWAIWKWLMIFTIAAWPIYLYLAMKRFYKQGKAKTFFKFVLLNIFGLVILLALLIFFSLFSVFQL